MRNAGLIALAVIVAAFMIGAPIVGSYLYTDKRRTDAMAAARIERERQTVMLRAICAATRAACPP